MSLLLCPCGEIIARVEHHGNPFGGIRGGGGDGTGGGEPVFLHSRSAAGVFPFAGVGDMEACTAAAHAVEHHEMVLIPVQDSRQWLPGELGESHAGGSAVEPQVVGGIGYPFKRHPLHGGAAVCRHRLQAHLPPEDTAYHRKACHSALHGIALAHESEPGHRAFIFRSG